MNNLPEAQASGLVEHLGCCEGCRRYHGEMLQVTRQLRSLESTAPAAPESQSDPLVNVNAFRRAGRSHRPPSRATGWLGWHVLVPAAGMMVLTFLVLFSLLRRPVAFPQPEPQAEMIPASKPPTDLAPTLANYRAVANQSLDQLDDLLARQGRKPLAPALGFSASRLALLNSGE